MGPLKNGFIFLWDYFGNLNICKNGFVGIPGGGILWKKIIKTTWQKGDVYVLPCMIF